MARPVYFAIPGDLNSQTGGYAYARHVIKALPNHGWEPIVVEIDGSFPNPSEAALEDTKLQLSALSADVPLIVDGLAYGALPATMLDVISTSIVALVHHPLALETGVPDHDVERLRETERMSLSFAQAVVATSKHTAQLLSADYGVAASQITVAEPGIAPTKRNTPIGSEPLILAIGTATRRKAPDHLIEALASLKDRSWRAIWCGDTGRDAAYFAEVEAQLKASGVEDRFRFTGTLPASDLAALYQSAYLFALPARYEGFGMAFAEAVRCGLPVIGYDTGAVAETVADGGLLVPDNDVDAFGAAIDSLLSDEAVRERLADAAWHHGAAFNTWDQTAGVIAETLDRVAP